MMSFNFSAFELTIISVLLLYSGFNIGIARGLRRAQKMRKMVNLLH